MPYKIHGRAHHTICMEEAESPPTPDLPYKIHGDHPRGRREEDGPVGHLRWHDFPREVSEGACQVGWSVVAVYAINRVCQCVFSPLSYWIHVAAPGDKYTWLFPT